uniref:Chemokine interleukin-8-like domain-containing protein n=1 Tax=Stegastes partitus TaxID=144197 RepID=A0A3B5BIR3_9TELE
LVLLRLWFSVFIDSCLRGVGPKKCCFRFNEKPVSKDRVVGYAKTSQRCSQAAVLLNTVANRQLCVRPAAAWVKELIRHLDAKSIPGNTSNL